MHGILSLARRSSLACRADTGRAQRTLHDKKTGIVRLAASIAMGLVVASTAYADPVIYASYSDTGIGYPAVLATVTPSTGAVTANHVLGQYFGGGSLAPLQYPVSGVAYGSGALYAPYTDTGIGYPAVIVKATPETGAVLATNVVGEYFGGGALAPLQYPIHGLAYGGGSLYGAYTDTAIGYPTVIATIDPATGAVSSTSVVGQYFSNGTLAPLQYQLSALAYGDGKLYGVFYDTAIGYPAELVVIDPLTGAVESSFVIGQYFGGGTVAPLQYAITGLTYGNGELYGVYADTGIGYPAVLAAFDLTGAVQSTSVIGQYFGGGTLAPLQYSVTGLAFVDDATTPPPPPGTVPEPTSSLLLLVGAAALVARGTSKATRRTVRRGLDVPESRRSGARGAQPVSL